ncbi:MAG: OmpH family outer membrane protein [Bacteroidales bacterium]|nr:OmpH family outer membrane protein [Bacteroidales bacterium]
MKRFIGIVALISLFAFAGQDSSAQNLKFGHINRNDLIQTMPEFDEATAALEKMRTTFLNELELLQVEFNNKYDTYLKEMKNYTDLVRQTKEQELADFQTRMQTFQNNASTTLQEEQAKLFTPITQKADKAISDVGRENGYIYVFDISAGTIAYFDTTKSTDVLSLVKTKLGIK